MIMFLKEDPLEVVKNHLMYIKKLLAELHYNKSFHDKNTISIIRTESLLYNVIAILGQQLISNVCCFYSYPFLSICCISLYMTMTTSVWCNKRVSTTTVIIISAASLM